MPPLGDLHSDKSFPWKGLASLAVMLIVGALLWFGWQYYTQYLTNDVDTGVLENPAAVLLERNSAYAEAVALHKSGLLGDALAKFEESLATAEHIGQEAHIRLQIAHVVRDQRNYVQAVQLYKTIVNNEKYPVKTRAYAAQSIAMLADVERNDAELRAEVFSGEPYEGLYTERVALANRRLYAYVSNLYPLALSDLRVALWYADRLRLGAFGRLEIPPERVPLARSAINDLVARADTEIARNDSSDVTLVPEILRVRALIKSALAFAGYGSHEEADAAYRAALDAHTQYGAPGDGYMRVWYAYYLASFEERHEDMLAVIAPLYTDPAYAASDVASFLGSARTDTTGTKASLRMIALADPAFREFLTARGWTAIDFE